MDVMALIDKLDELAQTSRSVPMTEMAMMDRQKVFGILDEMRSAIPDEIKQAKWVVRERQEMLEEAQREADRLIKDAEAKADRMVADTEIVRLAQEKADEIMNAARKTEAETRRESLEYADKIFAHLEIRIGEALSAVEKTREKLHTTDDVASDNL